MSAGESLPTHRLRVAEFARMPNQTARMGNSGQSVRNTLGPSLWSLTVETGLLGLSDMRLWSAWLARHVEGVTFTAFRLWRANPQVLPLAVPDGSLGISVDVADSEITLSGVGAYTAKQGDMISWRTAAIGFCCVEATADATASGGSITIPVWPAPIAAHATPAVRRVQALAEFEITTDPGAFGDYDNRRLSFEAVQIIR